MGGTERDLTSDLPVARIKCYSARPYTSIPSTQPTGPVTYTFRPRLLGRWLIRRGLIRWRVGQRALVRGRVGRRRVGRRGLCRRRLARRWCGRGPDGREGGLRFSRRQWVGLVQRCNSRFTPTPVFSAARLGTSLWRTCPGSPRKRLQIRAVLFSLPVIDDGKDFLTHLWGSRSRW